MDARCSRCGATFACNPGAECWCMKPPYVPMPAGDEGCLCAACLERAREAAIAPPPRQPEA